MVTDYDGVPVLITEPEEVKETAGSLHCISPNIARCLKEYLKWRLRYENSRDLQALRCQMLNKIGICT